MFLVALAAALVGLILQAFYPDMPDWAKVSVAVLLFSIWMDKR